MTLRVARYFSGHRERLRLRQKEVADAVGITVPTLSRYENGKAVMPASVIRQLAAIYGVDPDGWKSDKERAQGSMLGEPRPTREFDRERVFDREDPRYWSGRWDQAVESLRRVLEEQESLAEEMREEIFARYRGDAKAWRAEGLPAAIPPVTPERLEQRIADQIPLDALETDAPARARG